MVSTKINCLHRHILLNRGQPEHMSGLFTPDTFPVHKDLHLSTLLF